MEKKVRFGIIGAGNMGTGHLGFFNSGLIKNGELAAIADVDAQRLAGIKDKAPKGCAFYLSGKDLIDSGTVDAVIVATPHYSHPELSAYALGKGINVICEKPAGVYTRQVEEMNAAAEKSDALFTVMFNQRTNPLYKKMRALIEDGLLGAIKRVNWLITTWYRSQSYYDSGSWRATWAGEGGGVLFNQCPHQLDLLLWITGLSVKNVRAHCHFGKWHDIEVEDDVTAYLEFHGGATGMFITSTADTPGTNRFEILGTKGKLVCEGDALTFYELKQDEREFNKSYKGGFGEPEFTETKIKTEGENTQHAGIINNFANAILKLEPLFVDGREGIRGVELADGMLLSQWLDETVAFPVDGELYLEELQKRIRTSKVKSGESVVLSVSGTYGGRK